MTAGCRRLKCVLVVLLALATVLLGDPAANALARSTDRRTLPCQSRQGTMYLANRDARVYSHLGRVYACRLGSASVFLFPAKRAKFARVELSGRFVAWREELTLEGGEAYVQRLAVLDLARGKVRRVGSTELGGPQVVGSGLSDFAVTARGTVVWLLKVGYNGGGTSAAPFCSYSSKLYEHAGHHTSLVDQADSTTRCAFPIASFGLSTDGRVVYWTNNGDVRSHPIP